MQPEYFELHLSIMHELSMELCLRCQWIICVPVPQTRFVRVLFHATREFFVDKGPVAAWLGGDQTNDKCHARNISSRAFLVGYHRLTAAGTDFASHQVTALRISAILSIFRSSAGEIRDYCQPPPCFLNSLMIEPKPSLTLRPSIYSAHEKQRIG
jgi:hypothetical protein